MTRVLMIAAPKSGSGKTTVTLALLAAFRRRGLKVRALKTGPDYIDPAFHEAATGEPCANLDSWAMPASGLAARLETAARNMDLLVIESSMGLFDGLSLPDGARGAASDIAAFFALPVLLVLDVRGQGQTVGAVAQGLASWSEDVSIAGVILNHVASDRHEKLCRDRVRQKIAGVFRRDPAIVLPERHLGLVQARERGDLGAYFMALAEKAEKDLDLDGILSLARPIDMAPIHSSPLVAPPGQRIAVANDAAFSFLYAHLAQEWQAMGAELLPFSPLNDEAPSENADICWLPGGYPELHAGRLASALHFRAGMRDFAQKHPVHGECGGFMVLGAGLEDASGQRHQMLGLLSHETSFAKRKMNLGYRQARLCRDSLFGPAGYELRGHEFHYARLTDPGRDNPFAELCDGEGHMLGAAGGQRELVSGTFFHVLSSWT